MTKTETRIGSLVVVMEGTAFGNLPNTVTKVLSKEGAVPDSLFGDIGTRYPQVTVNNRTLMCEAKGVSQHIPKTKRFLNKPAVYEHIDDLRPATETEKQSYRKSK